MSELTPGRPVIEIDYDMAGKLAGIQCTIEEIAGILGVSKATLEKDPEFLRIYYEKKQSGKASLRRRQWLAAIDEGNPTLLIWLGKNYLAQTDKMEHSGEVKTTAGEIIKAFKAAQADTELEHTAELDKCENT